MWRHSENQQKKREKHENTFRGSFGCWQITRVWRKLKFRVKRVWSVGLCCVHWFVCMFYICFSPLEINLLPLFACLWKSFLLFACLLGSSKNSSILPNEHTAAQMSSSTKARLTWCWWCHQANSLTLQVEHRNVAVADGEESSRQSWGHACLWQRRFTVLFLDL